VYYFNIFDISTSPFSV